MQLLEGGIKNVKLSFRDDPFPWTEADIQVQEVYA
jgi:hypothetical protein